MPRYAVTVLITNEPREKEINVWAPDPEAAEEKACQIVEDWNGVASAEAIAVEEIDDE